MQLAPWRFVPRSPRQSQLSRVVAGTRSLVPGPIHHLCGGGPLRLRVDRIRAGGLIRRSVGTTAFGGDRATGGGTSRSHRTQGDIGDWLHGTGCARRFVALHHQPAPAVSPRFSDWPVRLCDRPGVGCSFASDHGTEAVRTWLVAGYCRLQRRQRCRASLGRLAGKPHWREIRLLCGRGLLRGSCSTLYEGEGAWARGDTTGATRSQRHPQRIRGGDEILGRASSLAISGGVELHRFLWVGSFQRRRPSLSHRRSGVGSTAFCAGLSP